MQNFNWILGGTVVMSFSFCLVSLHNISIRVHDGSINLEEERSVKRSSYRRLRTLLSSYTHPPSNTNTWPWPLIHYVTVASPENLHALIFYTTHTHYIFLFFLFLIRVQAHISAVFISSQTVDWKWTALSLSADVYQGHKDPTNSYYQW